MRVPVNSGPKGTKTRREVLCLLPCIRLNDDSRGLLDQAPLALPPLTPDIVTQAGWKCGDRYSGQ
jgi:hypothetical protein